MRRTRSEAGGPRSGTPGWLRGARGAAAAVGLLVLVGCGSTTDEVASSEAASVTSLTTQAPSTTGQPTNDEASGAPSTTAEPPSTTATTAPPTTAPPSTTPPRPQPCGDMHFEANTDWGAWEITATGVDCDRARELVQYMKDNRVDAGERALGFLCTTEELLDSALQTFLVVCDDGTASVTWTAT